MYFLDSPNAQINP